MIYLAWFILFFAAIQSLVAITNLIIQQNPGKAITGFDELVSVLIPARNEEKNIGNILNDLLLQDYMNIEILVFNDQSTDKTEEIVSAFSEKDNRVKLINSKGLPDGWLGKNYACHSLSKQAHGKYLLFLDADVRIGNQIIAQTISVSEKYKLGLLSIFPKQMMHSIGEWITVPNMNYILLSLLPLILVRKSGFSSFAAANGQFMLFNSAIYLNLFPHQAFRQNKVEDIEIARYYKSLGLKIACLSGNHSISCRMYNGYREAVDGFSKNVINFFGNSYFLAIFFWILTSFGIVPILFFLSSKALIIYILLIISKRIIISSISKQNLFYNLIFVIPQQITMGLFIYKSIIYSTKKQFEWKGRSISL
jgi:glycosyltransferase involved in cell wall biosynthesis